MRGYNRSGKPEGINAYRGEYLAGDVAGLIRAVGADRAVVVGHDWGAGVAWEFAMRYPELLDRLVILNVPHPARMLRGLRTWRQLLKSWYMFFFQLPGLPEAAIRAGNYASLRRLFQVDPRRPGAFTPADIERYVEAAAQPGALTAAINYYRALFRRTPGAAQSMMRRIDAPVLVIWGEQDRYLGRELAAPDPEWVPHAMVERLPHASHWVQADDPDRVNQLLIDFIKP
jgi:pimeloyl-ACP methyl ester carboxylesterase